jgi:hypothetical protein
MTAADETRLRGMLREKLLGAELIEAKTIDFSRAESRYAVAWRRAKAAYQPGDGDGWTYGTHVACLSHTDDRTMLVWGHYDIGQREDALADMNRRVPRATAT